MTRANGKPRHVDVLVASQPDDIMLCGAVRDRFVTLCDLYLSVRGEQLPIPKSLTSDILRWRTMAVRFKQGDFRHTDAEMRSLKAIAQYTVDQQMKLRNQPEKIVQWKE